MTVRAQLVESLFGDDVPPGAFKFYSQGNIKRAGFNFRCPCGCDLIAGVNFPPLNPGWEWNGSVEAPSLHPSVKISTGEGEHWHGWLKDGEWRSC